MNLFLILDPQVRALGFEGGKLPLQPPFTSAEVYDYVFGVTGGVLDRLSKDGASIPPLNDCLQAAPFLVFGPAGDKVEFMSTMSDRNSDPAVNAHAFDWQEGVFFDHHGPGSPGGLLALAHGLPL
jgi:hypothetical protein